MTDRVLGGAGHVSYASYIHEEMIWEYSDIVMRCTCIPQLPLPEALYSNVVPHPLQNAASQ
jgi:hypothetical protein